MRAKKYFVDHHHPIKTREKGSRATSLVICAALLCTTHLAYGSDKPAGSTNFLASVTNENWGDPDTMDRAAVIERTFIPYKGESHPGVDVSTLTGKVMCGYQGWFSAEGDGDDRGWTHWASRDGFKPGSAKVDLWPDVSELDPDERYATSFKHADGRTAEVYSAYNRKTVLRHFKWMKDYGIDGVFVQRFINDLSRPSGLRHVNVVLNHCREGANLYGRSYAVMYDLSGMGSNQMNLVMDDWKLLIDKMQITKDPAYQRHAGKPVVAIWGFGFNDNRKYTVEEGLKLVKFLEEDPRYGGCTVMLGVPTYWRTLNRDCITNPILHELILKADIVSPWTVGRYTTPETARQYAQNVMTDDIKWCRDHQKEYLPVVFPGFSWHNMYPRSPQNQIPRRKGEFLWTQFVNAKKAGATMVYQAMFDEMDEGTAIFKCTDDPPVGESKFVNYEGLPSDFYLNLVGQAARMMRGELPVAETVPLMKSPAAAN
jgi:hypothetical protein